MSTEVGLELPLSSQGGVAKPSREVPVTAAFEVDGVTGGPGRVPLLQHSPGERWLPLGVLLVLAQSCSGTVSHFSFQHSSALF